MASPVASGTSTPATGLIHATIPLPKPRSAPSNDCSPWPLLCRPPQRSADNQLEEMRYYLERLAEGQARVEALLRERGMRDLSGANKNITVNQQFVVNEQIDNGTSKIASPASAEMVELFPDTSNGKPFELAEALKAMYLKQDRLEQRVVQVMDKVATDVSEKIMSNPRLSMPAKPSPRGKRARQTVARQSQASKKSQRGEVDPVTGKKKSQKAGNSEDAMVEMQKLQQQMAQYQSKRDEKILKKMKSKDADPGANGDQQQVSATRAFDDLEYGGNACVRKMSAVVHHPAFDGLCALMIMWNSVLIGISVEETVKNGKEAKWMEMAAHVCNTFFLLELIMRMTILGKRYFLSEDWTWNTFDFVLVLFSIVDVIMTATMGTGASSLGSGMKTIKMLRIVRIFRVFRFFRELSLLALMIADSIKSLVWALLMLMIIIYVFAICFTQSCSDFKWANQDEIPAIMGDIHTQFGSLPKTIYFLVLSMLGGISWGEVSDTLFDVDALSAALFLFYIFFTLLAVLNIITGVFVDNAVETARTQRDYLASKERQIREKYVADMQNFFEKMDEDGSGTVTLQEMKKLFSDERIRNMFSALGIDPADMERLFLLLDDDNSGEINVDEFLEGCLRLKGDAKSIDVHTCLAVTRRILRRLDDIFPDEDKVPLPE